MSADDMVATLKSHPREFAVVEAVAAYIRGELPREAMFAKLQGILAPAPDAPAARHQLTREERAELNAINRRFATPMVLVPRAEYEALEDEITRLREAMVKAAERLTHGSNDGGLIAHPIFAPYCPRCILDRAAASPSRARAMSELSPETLKRERWMLDQIAALRAQLAAAEARAVRCEGVDASVEDIVRAAWAYWDNCECTCASEPDVRCWYHMRDEERIQATANDVRATLGIQ